MSGPDEPVGRGRGGTLGGDVAGPVDARAVKRDGAVRRVVRAWRELTGQGRLRGKRGRGVKGARTLVACSGGADSAALAVALACAEPGEVVLAHVVHDMRAREEALDDRDAVRGLAARLGVGVVEAEIGVKGAGNVEGAARRARYGALVRLAREQGAGYVATGHHAGDQLETVVMALVRGAGARGLAGMAAKRRLSCAVREADGEGVWLIRPALGLTREECEGVCRLAGYEWRVDATNADVSRVRGAVRARVAPELRRLRPGIEKRLAASGWVLRDAQRVVSDRAAVMMGRAEVEPGEGGGVRSLSWLRGELRGERPVVIGELVRMALVRLLPEGRGLDRAGSAALVRAARAVRSAGTNEKRLVWSTIVVIVGSRRVTVRRKSDA